MVNSIPGENATVSPPQGQGVPRTPKGQFPKGVSGNPGGMPHGTPSPKQALRRLSALSPGELEAHEPKDMAEEIAKRLLQGTQRPDGTLDVRAVEVIFERVDGKEPLTQHNTHRELSESLTLRDRTANGSNGTNGSNGA